jgi:hypothetical protein
MNYNSQVLVFLFPFDILIKKWIITVLTIRSLNHLEMFISSSNISNGVVTFIEGNSSHSFKNKCQMQKLIPKRILKSVFVRNVG